MAKSTMNILTEAFNTATPNLVRTKTTPFMPAVDGTTPVTCFQISSSNTFAAVSLWRSFGNRTAICDPRLPVEVEPFAAVAVVEVDLPALEVSRSPISLRIFWTVLHGLCYK